MNRKVFAIDTEFNEFGGELISMALVDVNDITNYFYEVIDIKEEYGLWVKDNVVPYLDRHAIGDYVAFKRKLSEFLMSQSYGASIFILADWPDDIRYFCDALIKGPGEMYQAPVITCQFNPFLSAGKSAVPHNAYHDAVAIAESYKNLTKGL